MVSDSTHTMLGGGPLSPSIRAACLRLGYDTEALLPTKR